MPKKSYLAFHHRGLQLRSRARSRRSRADFLESLESRVMMDAGEWLVHVAGLPGDTRDVQTTALQRYLSDSNIQLTINEHVGVDGTFILQSDPL